MVTGIVLAGGGLSGMVIVVVWPERVRWRYYLLLVVVEVCPERVRLCFLVCVLCLLVAFVRFSPLNRDLCSLHS